MTFKYYGHGGLPDNIIIWRTLNLEFSARASAPLLLAPSSAFAFKKRALSAAPARPAKRAHIQGAPAEGTAPALKIVAPEPRWGMRCVGRDRGAAPGRKAYGITTVRRRQHSQFWRSIQWQTAHRCDLDCAVIGWAVRAAEQDPQRGQGLSEAHPTALRPSSGCQPWCAAPVRCQCSVCVGMGARGECGVGFKG